MFYNEVVKRLFKFCSLQFGANPKKGIIMSKVTSSYEYPSYSGGSVSIGDSKASTGLSNGILASNYDMSEPEAAIYNYALNTLATILPQVNTFSQDTADSINSQVNAYKNQGVDTINQIYNPMISNLKNDIVSRFGNLDNSMFSDNLNDIESKRSSAISSFAQDVLAKQNELETSELKKRYALVDLLSGIANNTYNNALNAISTALGGSSSANSYNSTLYKALSDLSTSNYGSSLNTSGLLSSLLGLTSSSGGSSFLNLL